MCAVLVMNLVIYVYTVLGSKTLRLRATLLSSVDRERLHCSEWVPACVTVGHVYVHK